MKVIVGLGNPGLEYAATRHNVGFMVVDKLASALQASEKPESQSMLKGLLNFFGAPETVFSHKKDLFAEVLKVKLQSNHWQLGSKKSEDKPLEDLLLVKPTTYMNLTGKSVQAILSWYKLSLSDFLVIHDDVSLPLGKLRLQKDGGAGGQHGIESIIETCGGKNNFSRLKVGVGPDPGGDKRANYVLAQIPQGQKDAYDLCIATCANAALDYLRFGIAKAMNQYNGMNLLAADQVEK